ncbi:MAG: hypothetical protein NTW15_16765 [Burkholderiales bacterium]|nr:hypothetical protein [Burkholderiales bacterium]
MAALRRRDHDAPAIDHRDLAQQRLLARQRLEQGVEGRRALDAVAAQRLVDLVEQAPGLQQRAVDLLGEDAGDRLQAALGGGLDRVAQLQRVRQRRADDDQRAQQARQPDELLQPQQRPAPEARDRSHRGRITGGRRSVPA